MLFLIVAAIVFFGVVAHTILGFGVALICMPLLILVLSPVSAAAFVALFTIPLQIIIIWRYRRALRLRPFWRVILGTALGAPLGVFLIARLDERIILSALGLFLVGYALYNLFNLRLPRIVQPKWDFSFGLASGVFAGAYNTGGPPLVIYGTSLGWNSEQFKANLQALFMLNSFLVIILHIVAGHVDALVLENLAISLPVVAVGTAIGFRISRYVNEALFRKCVLALLIIVGLHLLLS
ncbi:MAG: TSUP family transporter [Chloroflexi bacterium]|nr:TSUP family transporter [Chloroflexota bacterium]